MLSTSEHDPEWGLHFLISFPSTIRDKAPVYHAAWLKKGFGPKVMLGVLKEDDLIRMKFPDAHARLIIDQIELMFAPVSIAVFVAPSVPVVRTRSTWSTKNMKAMESSDPSSSTGTLKELQNFLSLLIVFCEQNDDTPGTAATKALGAYAEAPIGPGPQLDQLNADMDVHASRQCAAAVLHHLPVKLRDLVDYEVGLQAGIFPILGALYYPHLGDDAVERQLLEDTELVTGTGQHKKGPAHRYEVYAHIIRITAATKRLTAAGQSPSDLLRRQGLEAAVSQSNFDDELKQFERDVRRDSRKWDAATVLAELKRHAQSWATSKASKPTQQQPQQQQTQQQQQHQNPPGTKKLAKLTKAQFLALAAVAVKSGVPQTCYRWLSPAGCPNISTCSFQHPPTQKGASHLLPACQEALKAGGICPRLAAGLPCIHVQTCCYCLRGRWRCDGPVPCQYLGDSSHGIYAADCCCGSSSRSTQ